MGWAQEVYTQWPAWLHTNGWAGRFKAAVIVVGETPKRYRIRTEKACPLAGRGQTLQVGDTTLVPRQSITRRSE